MINANTVSTSVADTLSRLATQFRVRRLAKMARSHKNDTGSPALLVRTADTAGNPVIALSGNLDRASYDALIREAASLRAAGHTWLTIDLASVAKLELSGIYALHAIAALYTDLAMPDAFSDDAKTIQAMRRLAEANFAHGRSQSIRLVGLQPAVRAKLVQARLDQVFTVPHA